MTSINKKGAGAPVSFWTPEKIKQLKKLFPTTDNKIIAEKLGSTERAVRSKAFILRLKKSDRYWSKNEEGFLLKNWDVMSATELGEKLNKTKWAIINKYRELTGKRNQLKSPNLL